MRKKCLHIKQVMEATMLVEHPDANVYFPQPGLSTDNSIMIALAGHARLDSAMIPTSTDVIRADGNRSLS